MPSVRISGIGSYLPRQVVPNAELAKKVGVDQKWICRRTGIEARRFAARHETTADLATHAGTRAVKDAGLAPHDIDCILASTSSPDRFFPGVAVDVQARLKCRKVPAFDLRNESNGFVFGLSIASAWIRSGQYRRVLLVASEVHSRDLNFDARNRDLCVLFGDGAGAIVLEPRKSREATDMPAFELHSDGHFAQDLVFRRRSRTDPAAPPQPVMNKTSVIMHSSRSQAEVADSILEKHNISLKQIDFIIPHQSNKNLIRELSRRLDFPMSRIIVNIEKVGNTSSASIPIALDEAVKSKRIKRGDLLLLVSFGAGFSWGSALLRY